MTSCAPSHPELRRIRIISPLASHFIFQKCQARPSPVTPICAGPGSGVYSGEALECSCQGVTPQRKGQTAGCTCRLQVRMVVEASHWLHFFLQGVVGVTGLSGILSGNPTR